MLFIFVPGTSELLEVQFEKEEEIGKFPGKLSQYRKDLSVDLNLN